MTLMRGSRATRGTGWKTLKFNRTVIGKVYICIRKYTSCCDYMLSDERSLPVCCYCGACYEVVSNFDRYKDVEIMLEKGCGGLASGGACFSFCPKSFSRCGLCESSCPREGFGGCDLTPKYFEGSPFVGIGYHRGIVAARATEREIHENGQSGGVVTAILNALLADEKIDAAVVADRTDDWRNEPKVARDQNEVLTSMGSKYTVCPSIKGVWKAIRAGFKEIALVGMPCSIEAMRMLQALKGSDYSAGCERVTLMIGLFCTEGFYYDQLVEALSSRGIAIEDVLKFTVYKGKLLVRLSDKELALPMEELESAVRDSCRVCMDFASELADISAGSVGSDDGWTTLIIRTQKGEDVLKFVESRGSIETKAIDDKGIEAIRRLAFKKKRMNYGGWMEQVKRCNACLTTPMPFVATELYQL